MRKLTQVGLLLKERAVRFKYLIFFIIKNVFEDDCTYVASTLTFTSLLAIVPLMSVSFSILSSFPVFNDLATPIQNYIFEYFVPATGKVVQKYLMDFTHQVSKLSLIGIVFLFITSVLVMVTIEQSLNKIWKVKRQRHGVAAFLLYWAILSLTPAMIGLSIAGSSYFISLSMFSKDKHTVSILLHYAPFFLSFIGFVFLYTVVPNCKVKIRHAIIGAFTAAILMELAKRGFSWYTATYDTYTLLYGAFATVPIFFLWVYWAWFIVLLGAEVAYALSAQHQRRQGQKLDGWTHALGWLYAFWIAQKAGRLLTLDELIAKDTHAYQVCPEEMLEHLISHQLVVAVEENKFVLSRDLSSITIDELRACLPWRLAIPPVGVLLDSVSSYQAFIEHFDEKTMFLKEQNVLSIFQ